MQQLLYILVEGQVHFLVRVGVGGAEPNHVVPKGGQKTLSGAQGPESLEGVKKLYG